MKDYEKSNSEQASISPANDLQRQLGEMICLLENIKIALIALEVRSSTWHFGDALFSQTKKGLEPEVVKFELDDIRCQLGDINSLLGDVKSIVLEVRNYINSAD